MCFNYSAFNFVPLSTGGGSGGGVDISGVELSANYRDIEFSVTTSGGVFSDSATLDLKEQPHVLLTDLDTVPDFPQADETKLNVAVEFLALTYKESRNFTLHINVDDGDDFHGFVPNTNGGLLTYCSRTFGETTGTTFATFMFSDENGNAWLATLHGGTFKDFKALTGAGGGAPTSVSVTLNEMNNDLTVTVDGVADTVRLPFVEMATVLELQQQTLDTANQYANTVAVSDVTTRMIGDSLETKVTLANNASFSSQTVLPTGGGSTLFGVTDVKVGTIVGLAKESVADDSMILCDGSHYAQGDYPELYAAIGDDYMSVDTPPGQFTVPKIDNTQEFTKLSDMTFDQVLNTYDNLKNPTEQQIGATLYNGKAHFVLQADGNIFFARVNDNDTVEGNFIDSVNTGVTRFAMTEYQGNLHIFGAYLDKIYHTTVVDGTVTNTMVACDSPQFHNPLYVAYMPTAEVLIVVDQDRDGTIKVKAQGVTPKLDGDIAFDEQRYDAIAFPDSVTPLNLMCTGSEGQGFRAVCVAGDDGNTHVFGLESFFVLFEENTMLSGVQLTGISQSFPVNRSDTNTQYFCTDNENLYTIHMGRNHTDIGTAFLNFQRKIVDHTATSNLNQPFVRDGEQSFKKAMIGTDNSGATIAKSDLVDLDVVVQNTSHFIKAKIDYTQSPIVEEVQTAYIDDTLTVSVNGVSDSVVIEGGGAQVSDTTKPVVTMEQVGNPTFSGDKIVIASQFSALTYEDSKQFQLRMNVSNSNDISGFLPTDVGGVVLFDKYMADSDTLDSCFWTYFDRNGNVYRAELFQEDFVDFQKINNGNEVAALTFQVTALQSQVSQMEQTLQDILDNGFKSFELYSPATNTLNVTMSRMNPGKEPMDKTVVLDGQTPNPNIPDGNDNVFTVYHGWSEADADNITEAIITDTLSDDRASTSNIYGEEYEQKENPPIGYQFILDAVFSGSREFPELPTPADYFKHQFVCFPAFQVNPEIRIVLNQGQASIWQKVDLTINDVPYIALVSDAPNAAPIYSMQLSNGATE